MDLSLLESAFSAGIVLGGLLLSAWGGFRKNIYTNLSGIIGLAGGMGLIAAAKPGQFPMAIVGMAVVGVLQPIANGPIMAIILGQVDADMQGRILTLLESIVLAMMPLSLLVAAPVANWIGVRGWLAFEAVGCLLIVFGGFFIPELVGIEEKTTTKAMVIRPAGNAGE